MMIVLLAGNSLLLPLGLLLIHQTEAVAVVAAVAVAVLGVAQMQPSEAMDTQTRPLSFIMLTERSLDFNSACCYLMMIVRAS